MFSCFDVWHKATVRRMRHDSGSDERVLMSLGLRVVQLSTLQLPVGSDTDKVTAVITGTN